MRDIGAHTGERRVSVAIVASSLVVAAVWGLLAGPMSHNAYAATAMPPAVEEHFDSVYAFLEAGGRPQGRERVPCDATCSYLVGRTFPPPTAPTSPAVNPSALKRVGSRLYRLRVAARQLPAPSKFGIVGALTAVNAVVWRQVGTDLGRLFFGVEIPAQPTPTITQVRLVDEGQPLLYSGATAPPLTISAPENGISGDVWEDGGSGSCIYHGSIADPTFGGFGALYATGAGAYCGGPGSITYAYAYQAGVAAYVSTDSQPTTQPPLDWPQPGEGTNGEPVPTTKDRARTTIVNDPDAYGPVIARLDCLLGGDSVDPTGLCIKIPSCRTDTFQACRTRLQDAGFTGTITKHTLSADDAIMEDPADRVTATSPAAGTQTEHDTEITVYVNPDPMPTMTATETAIAEALQNNNPEQVNASNKKTLARQCERYATANGSGRNATDCISPALPIYIIGREWPDAADHTIRGLEYHRPWVALTYKSGTRTSWYYNYPETDGGAASCRGTGTTSASTACDEWPWQSTEQGGPSGLPIPHLKIINFGQNSASGSRYGRFATDCALVARKALPTLLNGGGNFLVIPVSKGAPSSTPSMSLCNGPNP